MQVRHSGDPDVIECALRDIPRIAVKVELRALRLPPLTVRYVRLRAPDASRLSHTHGLKLSPYSVPCPPIIPTRTLSLGRAVGKLTNLSSPAGLAVLTLASHVSGQGSIPGGSR